MRIWRLERVEMAPDTRNVGYNSCSDMRMWRNWQTHWI